MEINTNLSTTGVNGAVASKRSICHLLFKSIHRTLLMSMSQLSDRVSLASSSALEQALQNTPASRPEMVARAQSLIADPNYPSGDTLAAMSLQLARSLTSDNQ